jgi:diacylglycerol kinase (ATP)
MAESVNELADKRAPKALNGNNGPFTLSGRITSFRYAFQGVALMLRSQHNAWLHAFASVCILVTGGLFRLSAGEWCWVILAIVAVWTAEALNTALEFLADAASPTFHPLIKDAKDVAAGGVLISAIGSVVIGLLVLGPHLLAFLRGLF